ncbi:MAG: succinylglutamate desuccinylase/aspartoacylase family protein [Tistlia sp.]|uniref:succinylglutamate desuccinylase/aspartoacylase family protein n=1 Tax=Tistlia sp. TaxID=3057121 RepID=UPI0034A5972F
MPRHIERLVLSRPAPGTERVLRAYRWGAPDARPKAYLQAALHADETPGLLVAHHLTRLLDAAESAGQLRGQVVLVPYANPLGLAQFVNGQQLGRYELSGGGNFNRNWPDLAALAGDALEGRLGPDRARNVQVIRAALVEALAEQPQPPKELDRLRLALARLACDADLVLDLHCDDESLFHLFLIPQHWPSLSDLARELGSQAVLLAEDSGGGSFDEAFSGPWLRLARRFPDAVIPPACEAATVELRGAADVNDEIARRDAEALLRVLVRRGFLDGAVGELPEALCEATSLDAVDTIKAPAAGVLSYRVGLGAVVRKGEVVADLIDPAAEDPRSGRSEICAATDGFLLSRRAHKFVAAGDSVAKVVGREPLPHRTGYLLED